MPNTRVTITNSIETHPGLHFNELVRRLELAPGQLQYHIKQLQSTEDVIAESVYGKTHYFPPEYNQWERTALALLRRETAGEIVAYLLTEGDTPPAAVAEELDIARSTLEWHLDRLVEQGLVAKQRDISNRVTLSVRNADRTVELLREADPTLGERMVDRFTRLVDNLLDG
ncbi:MULTISPECIES: winged helix-turn-helix transcriptional regulator [unclassified Halobacterium]|jgi:predicted transcriptional regulator|uniref:winged helix-turn-helix transcriptional regulator n=1 Tax=unclassified Halobacterium TaxID=2668073 RepID=UPI001E287225|nr:MULTISPECIES: winged helix-turn-helix transcriptional regulator [unclassified Halobacterium]MCD2201107.1 winged helix-turn-helix transcriptional regulator [Halobacterium sp. KA-4]MCD2203300.1 winged helix-turn-helix transcriptional regulator [Halobacterium sp. KA-6]